MFERSRCPAELAGGKMKRCSAYRKNAMKSQLLFDIGKFLFYDFLQIFIGSVSYNSPAVDEKSGSIGVITTLDRLDWGEVLLPGHAFFSNLSVQRWISIIRWY